MKGHIFFIFGLSLMMVHEMDAVRCKEWHFFPGLSALNDKTGQFIFALVHIPLFVFILWQLYYNLNNDIFIKSLNIFMIVHLILHLLLLKHKNNSFKDSFSWSLIIGAGLSGVMDLLIN